jgi:hypothetical protein
LSIGLRLCPRYKNLLYTPCAVMHPMFPQKVGLSAARYFMHEDQ